VKRTYDDALRIARGCRDHLGGYTGQPDLLDAYQHGIETVIRALKDARPDDPQTRALAVGSRWRVATGNLYEVRSVNGNWVELARVELCAETIRQIREFATDSRMCPDVTLAEFRARPMTVKLAWFRRPDVREEVRS